jgi:hypothetical protein
MDLPDFSVDLGGGESIEKDKVLDSRQLKRKASRVYLQFIEKKKTFDQAVRAFPGKGEYLHVVNNHKYDFYTILPVAIDRLGTLDEVYISTWTMNRNNVVDLFQQFDSGKIKRMTVLTGLYFKRRETAVYSYLVSGLKRRGQRYVAFKNHCKILLASTDTTHLVIEGSANFTANPRMEQYVFCNSEAVYNFHKAWMEDCLNDE